MNQAHVFIVKQGGTSSFNLVDSESMKDGCPIEVFRRASEKSVPPNMSILLSGLLLRVAQSKLQRKPWAASMPCEAFAPSNNFLGVNVATFEILVVVLDLESSEIIVRYYPV
jgi:hypothetical protein